MTRQWYDQEKARLTLQLQTVRDQYAQRRLYLLNLPMDVNRDHDLAVNDAGLAAEEGNINEQLARLEYDWALRKGGQTL